jgi:LacI family transcriptional regulator
MKKVSLKEVANRLGVSIALVSYVANNREKELRISPTTVKEIRHMLQVMGYQPNHIAKSLKGGKTHTIGLIVADISNSFFSHIARIIEDEARQHGYVVIFGSNDENAGKSKDLIQALLNRQVDAFIIAPAANTEKQLLELQQQHVPFVLIDRYFPDIKSDVVRTDNFKAAYEGVQHLIQHGHKRIATLADDTYLEHMQERKRGYKEALKDAGIKFKSEWLQLASYAHLDVTKALKNWLQPSQKIDAIFFTNNWLAIEGLKQLQAMGIRIPDDIAVLSYDQCDAFDLFNPPITHISQSLSEIGREALRVTIEKINTPSKTIHTINIPATLVVKESCGEKLISLP